MPYSDRCTEPFSYAAIYLDCTCSLVVELLNGANKIRTNIVLPHGGPLGCKPYSVKGFSEINEDMVQILLMLAVLFTQDSNVEDLFCGASSGSEPSLSFNNYFFSLRFKPKPIQDDFQHDFARMTDEADSSVVLAQLQVAFLGSVIISN